MTKPQSLFLKAVVLLAILGAGVAGAISFTRVKPAPMMIELADGPFARSYLVRTKNLGDANQVAAYLIFQTGEADMTGPEGMLHYVEHLTWLSAVGSKSEGSDRHSNAWTDNTSVGYWFSGPKSKFKENLETLVRVFDPVTLPQDFALQERGIVQREYDFRVTNNPDAKIDTVLNRYLYAGNGLSRSVLGETSDIAQFDLQQALKMHDAIHVAANAVLVIIGDISPGEIQAALPKFTPSTAQAFPAPKFAMAESKQEMMRFADEALSPKVVWRRVVEMGEPVPYDLLVIRCNVLRSILDADLPGGLAKPLRFDKFVARGFDLAIQPLDERHVELLFTGYPDKNVKLADLQTAFEQALSQVAKTGIPKETFDRVLARFSKDWPDENDERAVSEWTKSNVLERVSTRHSPLTLDEMRKLESDLTAPSIDSLLRLINARGRTAIAIIGKELETK